jgi:hypothetical protein
MEWMEILIKILNYLVELLHNLQGMIENWGFVM